MPVKKLPKALGRLHADDLLLLLMVNRGWQPDDNTVFLAADVRRTVSLGVLRYNKDPGGGLAVTKDGRVVLNAVLSLIGDGRG